jgi:hypothetical protein
MKSLKKFLITIVAVVGIALSVSAQKSDDQQKPRPPKENPPKIDPKPKPPKEDKPKKPGMSYVILGTSEEMRA